MYLKELWTRLFEDPVPDDEEGADAQQAAQEDPSLDSSNTDSASSESTAGGAGVDDRDGTASQVDVDLDHDDDQDYDIALANGDLDARPKKCLRGLRSIPSRVWTFIFPAPYDESEIQAYIPHYRTLPIVAGITIPFCILLEIPGLTEHWYIHGEDSVTTSSKPNPPLLDVGIALSIFCAILANVCLVIRFLERRIKAMTVLCTLLLSVHDIINIIALALFGGTMDGYTLSQAFWMTLCSTIVSMFTNVTLIIDLARTPDFKHSGSGLTPRQRSLVIIIIGLFCYIALGALVNSLLLDLTFVNGLYFTVVTIETIGFGDIVPTSRSSRVFICFYATCGVINLAFVVGYVRETVLERLDFGYRRRLLAIQEKRRTAACRRRAENRWRHAIIWRLRERRVPIWIRNSTRGRESAWSRLKFAFWNVGGAIWSTARRSTPQHHRRRGMKLNLWALPRSQLEGAALEAGVPLDTLLPPDFYDTYDEAACHHDTGVEQHTFPSWFTTHQVYHRDEQTKVSLTHRRLGAMAAMITKLGFSVYESGGCPLPEEHDIQDAEVAQDSSGSLVTTSTPDKRDYRAIVTDTEKRAYYTRSGLSWGWFLIFWMGGALIFKATEGWTYGRSVYFCFIAFSTIGYGDLSPTTPAGRSIFVVWALIGVATITIFVSVVSEAYTSRYKGIVGRNYFKRVAQRYHGRTKVELSEKVERIGTTSGVRFALHNTFDREETMAADENGSPSSPTSAVAGSPDDHGVAGGVASTSKTDSHVGYVRSSLEKLPQRILAETRMMQQFMELMGGLDGRSTRKETMVDETLWRLIDDVMGGRNLPEVAKLDILKDDESRQMLMMLGIERSLKELVNFSEEAIKAIREQDKIIATLEQEK